MRLDQVNQQYTASSKGVRRRGNPLTSSPLCSYRIGSVCRETSPSGRFSNTFPRPALTHFLFPAITFSSRPELAGLGVTTLVASSIFKIRLLLHLSFCFLQLITPTQSDHTLRTQATKRPFGHLPTLTLHRQPHHLPHSITPPSPWHLQLHPTPTTSPRATTTSKSLFNSAANGKPLPPSPTLALPLLTALLVQTCSCPRRTARPTSSSTCAGPARTPSPPRHPACTATTSTTPSARRPA